ncbi:hypothetical protein [Kribbella sp. NPDC004536]|uniref:hypothetical protein n=1 Tax=Kribbella sp. NPDC004536 TaxID=3364106 RepID=UPI0036B4E280
MSMQTGDHHVDEVVQSTSTALQRVLSLARGLVHRFRQRLNRQQRMRMMMEHYARQGQWDPNVFAQRQQQTGPERTQDAELAARLAEQRDALQADVNARDARIQSLQQQADDRQRQNDQNLNNDRDRDGIDDRVQNRTDLDRDGIDDNVEESERTAEDLENDHDRDGNGKDDAAEHRQQQQAEADAQRKEQQDKERQAQENGEPGVDTGTAVGAAAGAAVVAEAADEELDRQNEAGDADNQQQTAAANEQQAEAANEQQSEAANQQQSEAANEQQAEVANEQGVDAATTNDAERGQAADPAINPDQQAEVENAGVEPSQAADSQLEAESAERGVAAEAGQQQDGQSPQQGGNVIAVGQGGLDNGQQNVVDWDTERDGNHIDASNSDPNTVYRVPEGQSVSVSYQSGADQDSPGMDMQSAGRDAAGSDREAINIGDISGDNRTFVVNQDGVHAGVRDGDRLVADTDQPGQRIQGQQPEQTADQPAFPTAGDAAEANRAEQQSMEQGEQGGPGGQDAQRAEQVAARDAQEKPVLDELRAGNAENRAKNPPGRAQTEMSDAEIGQQQHQVNAGRPSASEAPGYDGGELANSGASAGERDFADRSRNQGSRGPERGNDGAERGR